MRTRALLAALAVTALTAALAVDVPASGSTPNAGTLTATSGTKIWTGGPFAAPNGTGAAGAVDCTVPQSCDDYALTVSTAADTGDTENVQISVTWANTAADFDVYVLDRAGNTVATSASSSDPETITMPSTSGAHTVRVVPYLPLGSNYSASAALVTKPNDSAPVSGAAAPIFANYGAPATLKDAHNAGEPSIGNNVRTGSSFHQAYLSTYKVRFDDTTPARATWSDVSASATSGCPQGSTASLDPIMYTDATTGRTIESQLSGVDSLSC